MSLDTTMVSIHPHFTIKNGKMDQCIALLEEILIMTRSNEPDCLFFNITKLFEVADIKSSGSRPC